jgi:hypothetical protein
MLPSGNGKAGYLEGIVDSHDLRSAIAEALVPLHVDEETLRRGVWTYVGAERHKGTPPGHVIMSLTELVDMANLQPLHVRQALTRRVILWCVEAYFGHLGGESSAASAKPSRIRPHTQRNRSESGSRSVPDPARGRLGRGDAAAHVRDTSNQNEQ